MFKTLSALTLSAALAVGTVAPTPARAGDRDTIAAIVIGSAVLLAIAGAAQARDKKNEDRKRHVYKDKHHAPKVTRKAPPVVQHKPKHVAPAKPQPPRHYRVKAKPLPAYCKTSLHTKHGERVFYGKACLQRNVRNPHLFPAACEIRLQTTRGLRDVYQLKCLRERGYNVL